MKRNQSGFGLIVIVSVLAVLIVVGLAGWKIYEANKTSVNKKSVNVATKTDGQSEKAEKDDSTVAADNYDPAIVSTIKNFDIASSSLKNALVRDYYSEAKNDCDTENASVSVDAQSAWVISVQKIVRDDFAGVQFCGSGGTSILAKVNGTWEKIGSLAMTPDCKLVDQYKISKDITTSCYNEDGFSRSVDYL